MAIIDKYEEGSFSWTDLLTTDNDAAKKFYTALFGWSAKDSPMSENQFYTLYSLRGHNLAGSFLRDKNQSNIPPCWNAYFTTHNVNASVKKVKELGGEILGDPFPVFEDGIMAIAKDPQGAAFMLWQPVKHIGSNLMNEVGAICWTNLLTSDVSKANEFYCGLFGFKSVESDNGDGSRILSTSKKAVASISEYKSMPVPAWAIFFQVESIEKTLKQATDLNARIAYQSMDIGEGFIAGIIDPQGAHFGIFQLK